jgi:hypothetical protein
MCNLYSVTKGQQAIRDLVKAMRDLVPVTSFADAQRTAPHPAGGTTPVLLLRRKAGFPALHGNDRF